MGVVDHSMFNKHYGARHVIIPYVPQDIDFSKLRLTRKIHSLFWQGNVNTVLPLRSRLVEEFEVLERQLNRSDFLVKDSNNARTVPLLGESWIRTAARSRFCLLLP